MSLTKIKGLELHYVCAGIIAVIGCLYVAIVSLGSIREAKAAEPVAQTDKADAFLADDIDSRNKIEQAKADIKEAVAEMVESENNIYEEEALAAADSTATPQKMVTLLTMRGDFLADVCFEAVSDSVFMSYGWVGLATKALHHTNTNKNIDDIKIDVSDNCDLELTPKVLLETNPEAITVSNAIADVLY
ncbi:MAG: hypothetical protein VYA60_04690 [Pseudomonadota bacterium]|nr:hypothetical protein [Pseudomonadota bacterium]|tara:strand:+ start:233 stop:799 length:567 start_codon:yes stop_codon:yes gene_type:complete